LKNLAKNIAAKLISKLEQLMLFYDLKNKCAYARIRDIFFFHTVTLIV